MSTAADRPYDTEPGGAALPYLPGAGSPPYKDPRPYPSQGTLAKYRLSREDWAEVWDYQGGVCPLCNKRFATISTIDHDHRTGRVRGLLCPLCNGQLGKVHDDAAWMERAITYLAHPPADQVLTEPAIARTLGSSARRRARRKRGGK